MANTAAGPAKSKEARTHTVKITLDARGKIESVEPGDLSISKSKQEEVTWEIVNKDEYFTVDFGDKSPFYESQFSKDYPVSGLVQRRVLGDPEKKYKYTVRTKHDQKDPGIIVDT
jgi:hypothetical protein